MLKEVSVKSYNELMQEVQQQFLAHREETSQKFEMIEELMELAVQKFGMLRIKQVQKQEELFVNPFRKQIQNITIANFLRRKCSSNTLHHLKINFPKFTEESGVSEWLEDCEQYFEIFGVGEPKKVVVAGMQLEGVARRWFQVYTFGKRQLDWSDFTLHFSARFGVMEQELLYDKFKQLKQTSTVDHYFNQFEKCREKLKGKMPQLTEDFFVERFLCGLETQIKNAVVLLAPVSVEAAYKKARQYMESKRNSSTKGKRTETNTSGNSHENKVDLIAHLKGEGNHSSKQEIRENSCPLTTTDGQRKPIVEVQKSELINSVGHSEDSMEVSVHAIEGVQNNQTITLTGQIGKKEFSVLIDGGSTHSFLDEQTATRLKCQLVKTKPMKVLVANGNHLLSNYECSDFKWRMGKQEFKKTVKTLPMGNYDLVLGVDWLGSLGPVTFDFKKLTLQFQMLGQSVVLQGNSHGKRPALQQMTADAFFKSCQRQRHGLMYILYATSGTDPPDNQRDETLITNKESEPLQGLIKKYGAIFQPPAGLPPNRDIEHGTDLKKGSQPFFHKAIQDLI